jgi:hypothetical protein
MSLIKLNVWLGCLLSLLKQNAHLPIASSFNDRDFRPLAFLCIEHFPLYMAQRDTSPAFYQCMGDEDCARLAICGRCGLGLSKSLRISIVFQSVVIRSGLGESLINFSGFTPLGIAKEIFMIFTDARAHNSTLVDFVFWRISYE